ncbi:hypothetical protein C2U72_09215 [Prosthecomicrobium hirschii]|uniref:hypothetical protein n=1 Tax=Prosthecodimorpha hirschii TaxID=665126 RepID=UPI00112C913A|nr:hypothetical protein [Prosthecomicrobium hirschii]TPQ51258.1 hypothetical protein C2U72_09215 [Prosthecomicrobium hirschii]
MIGNWFLRCAVLFALAGMGLGIRMGIVHDFTLSPVHAHVNLVGFTTLFLAGLFYRAMPHAAGWLAGLHFTLALPGALALSIGIAGSVTGQDWGVAVAIAGSLLTVAAMLIFAIAVFRATGSSRAESLDVVEPGYAGR